MTSGPLTDQLGVLGILCHSGSFNHLSRAIHLAMVLRQLAAYNLYTVKISISLLGPKSIHYFNVTNSSALVG